MLQLEDDMSGPIGQLSFKSYLPSKKIYLSRMTGRDIFWALQSGSVKLFAMFLKTYDLAFWSIEFQK